MSREAERGIAPTNPATWWAALFVDALAQSGLDAVCISPGSRSTPLTLAFAAHPALTVYRHLDERSAGFFALGLALGSNKAVALVCTSGTAAANYFPAVIEARLAQVPLLLLTADRPPERRDSGANQTIDQIKLYGDQVLWSVDVALPEADPPEVVVSNLRALAARALATAAGVVPGPVHLNFPLRKPLQPARPQAIRAAAAAAAQWPPPPRISRGTSIAGEKDVDRVRDLIATLPRGLIVCGPRCPGDPFPEAVAALAQQAGYPVLADPLSGVRFGPWIEDTVVCGAYESFLAGDGPDWPAPQLFLRFGAVPTSKWLNEYLARSAPDAHVHVRSSGVWADQDHRTTHFLQVDEVELCRRLVARLPRREENTWEATVAATEEAAWQALQPALADMTFDGAFVAAAASRLPDEGVLFAGNSLSVRHLDQFVPPRRERLRAFANRGASGIDGNTSTALGLAAGCGRPVTAILGDLTFYHDLNGLLVLQREGLPLTIVLINNHGGGIFRRLPIADFEPPFTDLFVTPHGLDFAAAAQLYGLRHVVAGEREAFLAAFATAQADPKPWLIEVPTNAAADEDLRQQLVAAVHEAIRQR